MRRVKRLITGMVALMALAWGISRYIIPLVVTHVFDLLMHLEQGRPVTPETVARIAKIGQVQSTILGGLATVTKWASLLGVMIGAILIVWLAIDAITGQFMRDWKTPNAIQVITSKNQAPSVDDPSTSDYKLVNKIIHRLRIKQHQGKLVVTIWMASNAEMERTIKTRCDKDLQPWLVAKFKGSSWKPMEKRYWGPVTIMEMKEK